MGSKSGFLGAIMALGVLGGCALFETVDPVPIPVARPDARPAYQPSDASVALTRYYRRVQDDLLSQGLLRQDGGGPDTPYGARELARNFVEIALFEEYRALGDLIVAQRTESRLHRWAAPVRMRLEFGKSVSEAQRMRDRQATQQYVQRVSNVTGHPMSLVQTNPNYYVFFVDEDERRALGPRLAQIVPGLDQNTIDSVINISRSTYCLVFALDPNDTGVYTRAVAVIRSEHPQLLRRSCLHEEIAQGLGLPNDSPAARPSIFNDDEEFGLLTGHDEQLLAMLYDPRLSPGMTAEEAAPIAATIAAEFFAPDS